MITSDSQPIQFWPVDELTANEKDICGLVKQDCFCQPWQCDDEIIVQFQSNVPLTLQIIDPDDVATNIFTELFTSSLGIFSSVAPGDDPWIWDAANGGEANEGLIIFSDNSEHLQATVSIVPATYDITIDFVNGGVGTRGVTVEVYFGSDLVASQNIDISTASGTLTFSIVNTSTYPTISFVAKSNPSGIAGEFSITKIVLDKEIENVIASTDLEEISSGTWQKSFVPNDIVSPPICDQQIALQIVRTGLSNSGFTGTLLPWTNFSSGTSWVSSLNKASITLASPGDNSKFLRQAYIFESGQEYTIHYTTTVSASNDLALLIQLTGTGSQDVFNANAESGGTFSITFTANADYDYLDIRATNGGLGARTLTIDNVYFDEIQVYKSDCLDIKTTQECTQLISYSNSSNFDGLVYSTSPPTTFSLRIPAIFFEEDNPQEQEDLELSNGRIVTLRSTIQEKKKLDIGFVPNYMIKKIQKVLMHETIGIEGTYWKKRDSFDSSPISKYNLKRASVWLTKYNSVEKNTI